MIQWTYHLEFESAFGIFSGLSVAGLVDRMVVRDAGGFPVIPGSTVKGRWRFFAERILRAQNNGAVGILDLHSLHTPACKQSGKTCTICKWFGSPSVPAAVLVGPATLRCDATRDWPELFKKLLEQAPGAIMRPDTEIRPGVAISRHSRIAIPDHLFFDEAVPPVSFEGTIRLNQNPNPQEELFLKRSAALVDALGARKAVGRGRLAGGIRIAGGTP